ncbi:diaminopimelate decarboxylase [Halalkalibacterium halodurans]|uniref:diaminopimelate decarboxylase n=1 Tax=Halalkalibacterium halodurans TaxID=86665 RepID=UPI002AAA1F62|nr:diaminopimelate decarboxylase [Halalkalibacterium halodurans]MDY7222065.1 diaminopimelate decarboxylase [Halalkalibacterium halodurans]MDY7241341.1 diaminopimelate decarboxylase [Halalkalibacterium halodurans]
MFFHGTSRVNGKGHLEIGGVDTVELANLYGTPLFVYDVALIRERAKDFKQAFADEGVQAQVAYASKAFSCIAMFQLAEELGLSLDVVSGGELYTAQQAGVSMERIHFHGNNKSRAEIEMAVEAGIGCFVVDNFYELDLLADICEQKRAIANILLRITPGVEAHTHDYISTGQEDSKFGFDLVSGQATLAVKKALAVDSIHLLGVHSHIGSQIFETTGFVMAVEKIFEHLVSWREDHGFEPSVLNLGGGFGIRYIEGDTPRPVGDYVKEMIRAVKQQIAEHEMSMPEIWIEPGRSLVGDAGTTLYTIGSRKEIPNVRHYLSVDGGMSDNLRPALYQAEYEGALANRVNEQPVGMFSVAGKCCESGDMLIWDLPLPEANHEDILAVFCTGAYGYSMANNYNRIPRPPVVFVEDGDAQLVIQRERYEDLVRLDMPLVKKVKV